MLSKGISPLHLQGRVTAEPHAAGTGSHLRFIVTEVCSQLPCREQTQGVALCQEASRLRGSAAHCPGARLRECSARVLGKPQSNPAPNEAAVWGWQTPGNGTGCADFTLPLAIQGPKSRLDRALQGARDLLGSRSLSGCQELFALRGQGQWKSSPHANNMKTLQRTFLFLSPQSLMAPSNLHTRR